MRDLKETPKGVSVVSSVVDEMREIIEADVRDSATNDANVRSAITMLDDGLLPLDKIAAYSSLPLATVNHLAAQRAALS